MKEIEKLTCQNNTARGYKIPEKFHLKSEDFFIASIKRNTSCHYIKRLINTKTRKKWRKGFHCKNASKHRKICS